MLEQEVQEKYVLIGKLKKEIDELDALKSKVVNEINVPLLEAKKKADEIIESANTRAGEIVVKAKKIKSDADVYSEKTKGDATDMLHMAKTAIEELEIERRKFIDDKTDFEGYKIASENRIKNQKTEANDTMSRALNLKKETDELNINLTTRQATLDRLEKDTNSSKSILNESHNVLKSAQVKLESDIARLEKDREEVETQRMTNQKLFDDSNSKFESAKRMELDNKKTADKLAVEENKLKEGKNSLNKQFELLDKTSKDLDDRQLTIDANNRLLGLKQKEIDSKIATLNQLRKEK